MLRNNDAKPLTEEGGHVRQGDILIVRDSNFEANKEAQPNINGKTIIAEGEVTGHNHSIAGDCAVLYGLPEFDAPSLLSVSEPGELVHQEHNPITIPPGNYRAIQQRQYVRGSVQAVAD